MLRLLGRSESLAAVVAALVLLCGSDGALGLHGLGGLASFEGGPGLASDLLSMAASALSAGIDNQGRAHSEPLLPAAPFYKIRRSRIFEIRFFSLHSHSEALGGSQIDSQHRVNCHISMKNVRF